jgi:sporulation protein YlmC with PRC-barrel domain
MIMKHLLATAAIVALAGAANAAETQVNQTQAGTATEARIVQMQDLAFVASPSMHSHLASELIGLTVYSSDATDAEAIGEIQDLVIADNGEVESVVIGVGGLLGVGERNVAVEFEHLAWVAYQGDQQQARLVLGATVEQLESAPEFDISALQTEPGERLLGVQNPDGTTALAPDGQTAPDATQLVEETAMAPETSTEVGDQPIVEQPDQLAAVPGSSMTDVDVETISANDLIGATVYSAEDDNVGSVNDVLLAEDGTIEAVVLDIGGFLGIGVKPVAISFDGLSIRRDENNNLFVYTAFIRDQLDAAPDYDKDRYLNERDSMLLRTTG